MAHRADMMGTGKMRTVLGMICRFFKIGRFHRILSLVGQNALVEQAEDVFRNMKDESVVATQQYEDQFTAPDRLTAISKSGRTLASPGL